jgi:hypothetical protein
VRPSPPQIPCVGNEASSPLRPLAVASANESVGANGAASISSAALRTWIAIRLGRRTTYASPPVPIPLTEGAATCLEQTVRPVLTDWKLAQIARYPDVGQSDSEAIMLSRAATSCGVGIDVFLFSLDGAKPVLFEKTIQCLRARWSASTRVADAVAYVTFSRQPADVDAFAAEYNAIHGACITPQQRKAIEAAVSSLFRDLQPKAP